MGGEFRTKQTPLTLTTNVQGSRIVGGGGGGIKNKWHAIVIVLVSCCLDGVSGQSSSEERNCTPPSSDDFPADLFTKTERLHGALAIHFLVSLYVLYALLLVCDDYFVPSIESICRDFSIPADVAGATFMAMGTSAPELFTNVIGTFVTEGDLGLGTIVGSAVFNILAVGALCGIAVTTVSVAFGSSSSSSSSAVRGVKLEWWPLTRDSVFYLLSVMTLVMVLNDQKVRWTEALAMLGLYAVYVLVLNFDSKVKATVELLWKKCKESCCSSFCSKRDNNNKSERISGVVSKLVVTEGTPLLFPLKGGALEASDCEKERDEDIPQAVLIHEALSRSNSMACVHDECGGLWTWPVESKEEGEWKLVVEWVVSWPIRAVYFFTIPDCRRIGWRRWYGLTLVMCVAWIGALTYVISWMVTIIGETLAIPDSVTGLTFLAAGTSIPEVLSSFIVARQGLGSMGFSNSIGSNTFDVLVCLGLPWLIQATILSSKETGGHIVIHSGGLEISALLLISALVILYASVALNGFVLDRKIGVACIVMYIAFIAIACSLELNLFFPVNLPPC